MRVASDPIVGHFRSTSIKLLANTFWTAEKKSVTTAKSSKGHLKNLDTQLVLALASKKKLFLQLVSFFIFGD